MLLLSAIGSAISVILSIYAAARVKLQDDELDEQDRRIAMMARQLRKLEDEVATWNVKYRPRS